MDSPSTLTIADAVRVVAVLVFVLVVLMSVGLALVFRWRYIAAVVRALLRQDCVASGGGVVDGAGRRCSSRLA